MERERWKKRILLTGHCFIRREKKLPETSQMHSSNVYALNILHSYFLLIKAVRNKTGIVFSRMAESKMEGGLGNRCCINRQHECCSLPKNFDETWFSFYVVYTILNHITIRTRITKVLS